MKSVIKKWWFWIIFAIVIISIICISKYLENKKIENTFKGIGESASNYYEGINNANGYLNDFKYNYSTGKIEYNSTITLEMYNKIKKGMNERTVIQILGTGEKLQPEESDSYMIIWGKLNLSEFPYYYIQIIFNKDNNTVIRFNQLGLK